MVYSFSELYDSEITKGNFTGEGIYLSIDFPEKLRCFCVCRTFGIHKFTRSFLQCRKLTEVYAYNVGDFLSDLGGLSGLFLGFSLWGLVRMFKAGVERSKELLKLQQSAPPKGESKTVPSHNWNV